MALNFPSSPIEGQGYGGFRFLNGVWERSPTGTALTTNYIINPSMFVSQENGDVASAASATNNAYYAADMWRPYWFTSTGSLYAARWPGPSPSNSKTVYIHVTTTKAVLAGADYVSIATAIEGQRVHEFQWGTPQAQDAVLRFTHVSTSGGTYSVRISNSAVNRSYIKPWTASAGAWTTITIPITGDTTGAWLTDNGIGIRIDFAMAMGANYVGVEGWQSNNRFAVAGQTNGIATVQDWHITDVGLYRDPYSTGVAPVFKPAAYDREERKCQRYWYRLYGMRSGITSGTFLNRGAAPHPVPMRAVPAATIVGAPRVYSLNTTAVITSLTTVCTELVAEFDVTCSAGTMTAGMPGMQYWTAAGDYIAMSARI